MDVKKSNFFLSVDDGLNQVGHGIRQVFTTWRFSHTQNCSWTREKNPFSFRSVLCYSFCPSFCLCGCGSARRRRVRLRWGSACLPFPFPFPFHADLVRLLLLKFQYWINFRSDRNVVPQEAAETSTGCGTLNYSLSCNQQTEHLFSHQGWVSYFITCSMSRRLKSCNPIGIFRVSRWSLDNLFCENVSLICHLVYLSLISTFHHQTVLNLFFLELSRWKVCHKSDFFAK